jgi:broad specificity phosphatase PhoE
MQITLIRHLPTEWNKKTWLQGKKDIELSLLTEDLFLGIEENKKRLAKLAPFDLVLASTLKRTHQTAQLHGYNFQIEGLLDELDFGPFEGRPKKELLDEHGELWINNPKDLLLGESINNLEERLVLFLQKYKQLSNLLVFGHGSWIRAMISYSDYGNVNQMNKITVKNNACITLTLNAEDPEG